MSMRIGDRDIGAFMESTIGNGKLILVRYGPGSGGESLLKEFIGSSPQGVNGVIISTYETEKEMKDGRKQLRSSNIQVISLLPLLQGGIDPVRRRDRFLTEGIMVTDLLELSMTDDPPHGSGPHRTMPLSTITDVVLKQVMPFRLSLDSVSDLFIGADEKEVADRLLILKDALRRIGGIALVGAPSGWGSLGPKELFVFDAILECRSIRTGSTWERTLTLVHLRNSRNPPQQWSVLDDGK